MRFCIMAAARFSMPGRPVSTVGRGMAGLPARLTCRWSTLDSVIASRPQKVKKMKQGMPAWRAPVAKISAG
jgi:hypothetical protein